MSSFTVAIDATKSAWGVANSALDYITNMSAEDKKDPQKFAEAMMKAQLEISIATSVEQKASAAIDKAFQAHGAVASK